MNPVLGSILASVAGNLLGGLLGRRSVPRDPLQDRLVSEQLAQLQALRQLAPLLASQQTLAGIAQARDAMEAMLREAARRQGLLGTVDSAALDDVRGRALAGFGEAVARLRQQQPMLLAELLQGAQAPLQALQSLSAQRQSLMAQEAAMQQQAQEALGEALGSVLAAMLRKPPQRKPVQPQQPTYPWNPDVSLRLPEQRRTDLFSSLPRW